MVLEHAFLRSLHGPGNIAIPKKCYQSRKLLSSKKTLISELPSTRSPPCQGVVSKQLSTRGPTQSYPGGSPRELQVESVLILTS